MSRATRLYTDIDFTPRWYRVLQRRRRRTMLHAVLLLALIVAMAGLVTRTAGDRRELQAYQATFAEQIRTTRKQITEVAKLRAAQVELKRELKVHRQLRQPVSYSQISGTLAGLMPESLALRTLEMANDTLKITEKIQARAPGQKAGRNTRTVTREYPIVRVELEGLAPSDVEVANFIGNLAGSRLFQNVKMVYARQVERDERVTREFKISMEVPLDRIYEPVNAGEVADVRG